MAPSPGPPPLLLHGPSPPDPALEDQVPTDLLEDQGFPDLLEVAANTAQNKTVIIQVYTTSKALTYGLYFTIPISVLFLGALVLAYLWRKSSPASPPAPLKSPHQPFYCQPPGLPREVEKGRYSLVGSGEGELGWQREGAHSPGSRMGAWEREGADSPGASSWSSLCREQGPVPDLIPKV